MSLRDRFVVSCLPTWLQIRSRWKIPKVGVHKLGGGEVLSRLRIGTAFLDQNVDKTSIALEKNYGRPAPMNIDAATASFARRWVINR